MAAKGNQNAVGNSGGKSLQDRQLAADVRSLALQEIKDVLEKKKGTEIYRAVLIKLAGTVLPRLNEHTGQDGEKLFPTPILGPALQSFGSGPSSDVSTHNSNTENSEAHQTD
jgi:hypothetical protein